jgi:hypothetical protein
MERRYALNGNLRVFPYPPEWGCSIELVVNPENVIVGFNLIGDGCELSAHVAPW